MRATAQVLMVCVALGWAWTARTAQGGAATSPALQLVHAVVGQTTTNNDAAGRESERLLKDARRAMDARKLDEAERFIQQAERLNVKYDAIVAGFSYTPGKAREELQKLRGVTQSPRISLYAGNGISRFPSVAGPTKASAAGRSGNQGLLLQARTALASGDVASATRLVQQAKAKGGAYGPTDDSPAKVEYVLQQQTRIAGGAAAGVTARQYADYMMSQAEGFLFHKEFAAAEKLANDARKVGAKYRLSERTPDQFLQAVAASKQAAAAAPAVGPVHPKKAKALQLLAQAQVALDRRDLEHAAQFADQAARLKVPDSAFQAGETLPWEMSLRITGMRNRQTYGVQRAGYDVAQAGGPMAPQSRYPVQPGVYDPNRDATRLSRAQAVRQEPTPASPLDTAVSPGVGLYKQGVDALMKQDRTTALKHFADAWRFESELDPATRAALKEKLALLNASGPPASEPSTLEEVVSQSQLLRQVLSREITSELTLAERSLSSDPIGSLNKLQKLRGRVGDAELDSATKKHLLTTLDQGIRRTEVYIEQNRETIDLQQRNDAVHADIARERQLTVQMHDQIADLVEQFNTFIDERRYHEAELIAKQVRELDAQTPIAQTLIWKSRFIKRIMEQEAINAGKEQGFYSAIESVIASSEPIDDRVPFQFGDPLAWGDLTKDRKRLMESQRRRWLPQEVDIQRALSREVDVRFIDTPLAEAIQMLADLAGVNVHLDQNGLAAEAITSDSPINITLSKPVSLRSALNLILEPLRLSYVIDNEVLLITSETARESKVYTEVYNVADLVIPIPNFIPGYNVGLPAAIREAHHSMGYGGMMGGSSTVPLTLSASEGSMNNASALAQMSSSGMLDSSRPSQPSGYGPGGMGGAAMADFDTLIELITTTIEPQSWDDVGGPGAIESFPTNLSLVVSQTQEVHEKLADLLDQLRRLQDLQISIEVRFIRLNDDFFERIGIDFDFQVDDNTNLNNVNPQLPDDSGPSLSFGLDRFGSPTADLDLQFTQDSFGATVPQFGNFDANTAANFGFAILSDIEVFFLLQAAQGNTRSNVLQAPKVTLFNGQSATVSDLTQRPFVTSIIPVVGDFAAAHQPVVVVLNEGTTLSVQAVVSNDRRFVRLTLVPFFSQIGDVDTFTFTGATTSDNGSVVDDAGGNPTDARDNTTTTTSGTTVQLPEFSFTTVSTTVSVPDGGTVLLGGIKRLSEGRNERGVPMLSKLPYISRLFKNVGIGREANTLMLMVTPRIIIQEEEEAKLGIDLGE